MEASLDIYGDISRDIWRYVFVHKICIALHPRVTGVTPANMP